MTDWEGLVRTHQETLKASVRRRLRFERGFGESDVENVMQQAWLNLLEDGERRLKAYDPARPLLPFLLGVAMNACRDVLKKERLRRRTSSLPEIEAKGGPDMSALREAMSELPPRERLLLEWVDLAELPHKEVARLLGVAPNSVSVLAERARQKLKTLL